ncbi:MAG: NUDIX domain-containing protein [Paraclostridium sp.]
MRNLSTLITLEKYKRIAKEQIMPANGVFCILYCDNYGKYDYDVKVAMTMRWNNLKGFLGGKVDGGETLREALQREVMEEGNFDITGKEVEWLSSYADNNFGIHCYTCKITADEMKSLRENFTKGSHAEEEVAGLLVLNLKEGELNNNLLDSAFEASSKLELIHFMNKIYKRDTVQSTLALHEYGIIDNVHISAAKALLLAEAKESEYDQMFSDSKIEKYLRDVSDLKYNETLEIFNIKIVEDNTKIRCIMDRDGKALISIFFKDQDAGHITVIVKDLAILKMTIKACVYAKEFGNGLRNLRKIMPVTAIVI